MISPRLHILINVNMCVCWRKEFLLWHVPNALRPGKCMKIPSCLTANHKFLFQSNELKLTVNFFWLSALIKCFDNDYYAFSYMLIFPTISLSLLLLLIHCISIWKWMGFNFMFWKGRAKVNFNLNIFLIEGGGAYISREGLSWHAGNVLDESSMWILISWNFPEIKDVQKALED